MTSHSKARGRAEIEMLLCTDPEIEPFKVCTLKVDEDHELYIELCGNPDGMPLIVNHGGPGAGCWPANRRHADPSKYCIVCYDQRGANRSTPNGLMKNNTTWHLVSDIERIREHLGFDKWAVVMGGSWGSSLTLAYAITYPERVGGLVLRGVFVGDGDAMSWLFEQGGASEMYPDAWQAYAQHIRGCERHSLLNAYDARCNCDDPEVYIPACTEFVRWELAISKLRTNPEGNAEALKDTQFVVPFARAETQYFKNALYFPSEDEEADITEPVIKMDEPTLLPAGKVAQSAVVGGWKGGLPWLIRHCDRIAHIPTKIVHGRQDIVCRPRAALELQARIPGAQLDYVYDAGHSDSEPGTIDRLVTFTDALATESLFAK